ncbi:MAG: hypothetical protein ACXWJW_11495 [Xanthobacteraceae bacterium]
MNLRIAFALVALSPVVPASAGEVLKPEQAKQFVAGKYFAYNCFEGTSGSGRIQADGSVAGTIRVRGKGPARFVALPAGTIRVKPNAICASVRGMPMEPCFNVEQIDANSFRGSVAGLGFAYCTFAKRNPRLQIAQSGEPLSLRTTGSIRRAHSVKSAEMAIDAPAEAKSSELELRPSTSE